MIRRTCVISVLVVILFAALAAPALAYEPLMGYTEAPNARLVTGADPAVVVHPDGGGTSLIAQQTTNAGGPQPARTVTTGIGALGDWFAAGYGTQVTVVWKDGGTVWARCIDVSTGSAVFGPVAVCTDAAVTALGGDATAAVLSGAAPDGSGGTYVWSTATPSRGVTGFGDSLLNHLSAAGTLAAPDPGVAVAKGTISSLAADDEGHAFALLSPPGRTGMGTQRFSTALSPDWTNPISPYSPLVRPPAATPTAIAVTAGTGATVAWREGSKVKVQRYPAAGGVKWISPPTVSMSGHVQLASDGYGGAFLAGPSGAGIVACHVLSSGAASSRTLGGLTLGSPWVGALATNRAGDLFVGYGDTSASGASGVGLLTWLGDFTAIGPATMRPDWYSSSVPDGAGGAYLLGDTTGAGYMWRVGAGSGRVVTLRPRAGLAPYGKSVEIGGYVTRDGAPVGGASVTLTAAGGGAGSSPAPVQTGTDGYYSLTVSPKASAVWTATSGGATSDGVRIEVAPKVSLSLSHLKAGTRLSEIFSGTVTPNHAGSQVLIQKAVGGGWKKVASGKLSSTSRFRIVWHLPYRTADYRLRAIIPAHADHAQGASTTATLKVVIRKG